MSIQNIFITGATGKIGRFLVDDLCAKTVHNLFLLCREKRYQYPDQRIKCIIGDLNDAGCYAAHLSGIDTVVHLGGVTHTNLIRRYYEINAEATLRLIKRCEYFGVKRFIFISSRAASEEGGDYSHSKLIAERYVQESSLNWVIIRLSEVYGTSTDKGIDAVLENIHKIPVVPIIGSGRYTVSPVHIADVVWAIRQLMERTDLRNKIYTVGGPESLTYNEFIDIVLKTYRIKRIKVYIPVCLMQIVLNIFSLLFNDRFLVKDQLPRLLVKKPDDISLAERDFGFNPKYLDSELNIYS